MHNPAHSKLQKELNKTIQKYNNELGLLINTKVKYTQYTKSELNKPHVIFYGYQIDKCREEIKKLQDKIPLYKKRIRIAQRDHN